MRDKILLVLMALIAVFFFYRFYQTREYANSLNRQAKLRDSLIIVKDNMVAQLGTINKQLSVKNKELSKLTKKLHLNIKSYINILQQIKTHGKSGLRPDTIIVYKKNDSLEMAVKHFDLLSDDSSIYVNGYVTNDSVHADTMTAFVALNGYYGVDLSGKPWFIFHNPHKNVKILSDFQYIPSHKKRMSLSGGLFLDNYPGIIGSVGYNGWLMSLGIKTNGHKLFIIQKEVRF